MDDLTPAEVHCNTCGATPGNACRTPRGADTAPHQDRRANALVITRHMRAAR